MSGRASLVLPLALVAALVALFMWQNPFDYLSEGAPPAEDLMIESVRLDDGMIRTSVRSSSAVPVTIVQVQVDGGYRSFSLSSPGPIGYLQTVDVHIPYPWVEADAHHLVFLTETGTTFEHTIDVAVATPQLGGIDLWGLALVGLFVGFIPIAIGFAFYPAMQSFGAAGREFAMALTVGLLAFLLIDTVAEGLEVAEAAASGLKADLIVWLSALITCLALLGYGRRGGKPPRGEALAMFIAIGIGVHNLGEGLAIGASFAVGEVALASFLVLGFALHNVSEGIAISAPIRKDAISLTKLFWLALIAGGPAIIGTIAGAASISPVWTALAFGIGAGAILQVIIEVSSMLWRSKAEAQETWYSPAGVSGFVGGVAIMYLTAFMVHG
jgi:hypothetical protein